MLHLAGQWWKSLGSNSLMFCCSHTCGQTAAPQHDYAQTPFTSSSHPNYIHAMAEWHLVLSILRIDDMLVLTRWGGRAGGMNVFLCPDRDVQTEALLWADSWASECLMRWSVGMSVPYLYSLNSYECAFNIKLPQMPVYPLCAVIQFRHILLLVCLT